MRSAAHLSIESMCRLGQVSRAGFYRHWQEREPRTEQTELRARTSFHEFCSLLHSRPTARRTPIHDPRRSTTFQRPRSLIPNP